MFFFQGKWSAHSGLSISMGSPRRYIWCWALKVKLRRGSWPWLFQCFLAGRQGETKKPFASILLLKNLGFLVEFCWVATDWKVCHSFWRCPAIRSQLLSSWLRRLRQSEESDAAAPFQRGGCCLPQLWSATLAVKHHKPLILSFFLQVFALRTSKPSGK